MTFVNVIEQIGPSVSISANARIGAGTRLKHCIILDDVEIKAGVQLIGLKCMSIFGAQFFIFLFHLTGKCSCWSCNCWMEIIYWSMGMC